MKILKTTILGLAFVGIFVGCSVQVNVNEKNETDMKDIIGYDIILGHGGEVLTMPFLEGYSTTDIFEKILGTTRNG